MAEGEGAQTQALRLAEQLRNEAPNWAVVTNTAGGRFKNQFKKADKSGARFALILGVDEVNNGTVSIKDLRSSNPQIIVSQADIYKTLCETLSLA